MVILIMLKTGIILKQYLRAFEMERIIFRIDQDGNVTEEVQGVTNDTCIDITKEIEDTLGNVKSRELKPEYYQKQNVSLHQHQNETEG